jgi:hypothetical protein
MPVGLEIILLLLFRSNTLFFLLLLDWLPNLGGSLLGLLLGPRGPLALGSEHSGSHGRVQHGASVLDHGLHLGDLDVLVVLHLVLHVSEPHLGLPHVFLKAPVLLELSSFLLLLERSDGDLLLLNKLAFTLNHLLLPLLLVLFKLFLLQLESFLLDLVSFSELLLLDHRLLDVLEVEVLRGHLGSGGEALFQVGLVLLNLACVLLLRLGQLFGMLLLFAVKSLLLLVLELG